jgi:hypothetical protein
MVVRGDPLEAALKTTSVTQIALFLASSALTACSGDNDSSANPVIPVPSATPTPSPAPTPTPTPTPTVSYAAASDFTRDSAFDAITMERTFILNGTSNEVSLPQKASPAAGFEYTAATKSYNVRYNGMTLDAAPAIVRSDSFAYDHWDNGANTTAIPIGYEPDGTRIYGTRVSFDRYPLRLSAISDGVYTPATYSGYALWEQTVYTARPATGFIRYYIFGTRTVPSDLPTTGKNNRVGLSTVLYLGKAGNYDPSQLTTIAVDFDKLTISGETSVFGGNGYIPIKFFGTIDRSTGLVSGTTYNLEKTGAFEGAFYGPRGVELALLFNGDPLIGYSVVQ